MNAFNLIIVSGRSGSGKSLALDILEDYGCYCIDNFPIFLLNNIFILEKQAKMLGLPIVISVDARTDKDSLLLLPFFVRQLREQKINCKIVFLDTDDNTLLTRFSETRRKHPLTNKNTSLAEALIMEKQILESIVEIADLNINTNKLSKSEMRNVLISSLFNASAGLNDNTLVTLESFGFKKGILQDADYIFDVRCLPNPYWDTKLRPFTGFDEPIKQYFESSPLTQKYYKDILNFLTTWIPEFQKNNKSYLKVAIGCTGGQHRSVYIVEKLYKSLQHKFPNLQARHSNL